MDEQRLTDLLRLADVADNALQAPARFGGRVRQLHGRRRRQLGVCAGLALAVAIGVAGWQATTVWRTAPARETVVTVGRTPPASAAERLADVRRRIELAEQELALVKAHTALQEISRRAPAADLSIDLPPGARAAATMLLAGDERLNRFGPEAARDDYARVVSQFPGTPWADRAQQRLAALP